MNKMSRYYLTGASMVALTFSLLASTNANAGQCYTMPSCEAMGYTKSSCSSHESPIKCPFNTSLMKCVPGCDKTLYPLSSCDTKYGTCAQCGDKYRYVSCANGAVLNATTNQCEQYTVGEVYYSYGRAVGVVVYTTDSQIVLMSLHNVTEDAVDLPGATFNTGEAWVKWCKTGYYCKPANFPKFDCYVGEDDMDGYSHSQQLKGSDTLAGWVAANYKPRNCWSTDKGAACTKGNWYLPSEGELWEVEKNFAKINDALAAANGTQIENYDVFWTSSGSGSTNSCSVALHSQIGEGWSTIQDEQDDVENFVRLFVKINK